MQRTLPGLALGLALALLPAASRAAEGDWPCVQRRVGEIGAGQMWGGPPLETAGRWRDDPGVAALAAELAQRRLGLEEATSRIARFTEEAGPDKDAKLTALFARILERINAERSRLVAGIERYARKQGELAERVKQESLGAAGAPAGEAEERLRWDKRVYEERNAALAYVCESPGLLEQRAFALAREIQARLD